MSESTETIFRGVRAPPKKKLEVERAPKKKRSDTFEFQWELQVGSKWPHSMCSKVSRNYLLPKVQDMLGLKSARTRFQRGLYRTNVAAIVAVVVVVVE